MRKWLVDYRKESGKKQRQVAEEAQISQAYYASLERGIRGNRIAAPIAKRIAAVLGFPWTRFYEEDDGGAAGASGRADAGREKPSDGGE